MIDVDVAVIGSGFAGTLTAIGLLQQGKRVALIEREKHPRFVIGESSTPLANLLLEELADRYGLSWLRSFSKWGTWQRDHPGVACGLERGFTFYFHEPGAPFVDDERHERQLLVGASSRDEIADTHWYRPDFDHALVQEAEKAGAIYFDEAQIETLAWNGPRASLYAVRHGAVISINAGFIVDASGPRGFLHRTLPLPETPTQWLPHTEALYTHFEGVQRWDRGPHPPNPPYPPDDAAVHHVFPGGWVWVLRFNNGITSAGVAATAPVAARLGLSQGAPAWARLLETLPSVAAQFAHARPTRPFVHTPHVAFRTRRVAGLNWALLPSAAGVIDPLLSTGVPLTLLGVSRLLTILDGSPGAGRAAALREYEQVTLEELDATEHLVAALYATMGDPPLFKRLSLLYFAAASYTELARRIGRRERAQAFLLCDRVGFAHELHACAAQACAPLDAAARAELLDRIDQAIAPVDVAAFRDRSRRDWYPALPELGLPFV